MEFITINEYFYKLFSRLLLLLIAPIMSFVMLYVLTPEANTDSFAVTQIRAYVIVSVACLWLIAVVFSIKKIKSARKGQGLRAKLQKYFQLTIVRYSLLTIACLILAVGFFFTLDNNYLYGFLFHMTIAAALWPHGPRVAAELKLRGDEREMIYYRKDHL
ncbi:MAG TPA: hypothetical protein VD927_10660 [Chryseosolibacter sp.]|nr:hypothetical protein [Chryseosolibacter sp.]